MSALKRARDDEPGTDGAGGAPSPPPTRRAKPPPPPPPPADDYDAAYERRLKLTDVIGFVALNGYAREAARCAGLCRETWRCIPAGLSAADADRVRRDHPLWQAIIDLRHGKWKETRLSTAARNGPLALVRELCDWRADVEAADQEGRTPLWDASCKGRAAVVRELLARDANIEAASNHGATSLFIASQIGHLSVVRELLASGANTEAAANDGWTSLLVASENGHLSIVLELLARGANTEAETQKLGLTSLINASWNGHVDVVRALIAAGAYNHHFDNFGRSAASEACSLGGTLASRKAILSLLA